MIKPMLATDLAPDDPRVKLYLSDHHWIAERKYDGQRVLITLDPHGVYWQNRSGESFDWKRHHRDITEKIMAAQASLPARGKIILDGEAMPDGTLVIFDVLVAGNLIHRNSPLSKRIIAADECARVLGAQSPERATDNSDKVLLLDKVIREGHEGVIFKSLNSAYTNSRSRNWIKVKITATADLQVTAVTPTSCTLLGIRNGRLGELGRAAIVPKMQGAIRPGMLVEVRYLYVSAKGRLVQPRILEIRTDKTELTDFSELRQSTKVTA